MMARITGILSVLAGLVIAGAAWSAEVGDDGLHKQPWFYDSFLDMAEDLTDATAEGKDLIVLFEQNGCPYCRELHEVNFEREEIVSHIKEHYVVVQLDIYGSRNVTDFDGEDLEERDLAIKWGISFTPSTVIFAQEGTPPTDAADVLALTLPGYLKPFHYMTSLEFVTSDEFKTTDFQRFLRAKLIALDEQGIEPDVW